VNRCAELLCGAFAARTVLARQLACVLDAGELAFERHVRAALLAELARLVADLDIEAEANERDAFTIWDSAPMAKLFEAIECLRRIDDDDDIESRLPIWSRAKSYFSATP